MEEGDISQLSQKFADGFLTTAFDFGIGLRLARDDAAILRGHENVATVVGACKLVAVNTMPKRLTTGSNTMRWVFAGDGVSSRLVSCLERYLQSLLWTMLVARNLVSAASSLDIRRPFRDSANHRVASPPVTL